MSFKSEIQIANSWRDNSLRFAKDEAIAHAYNLMMRRFSVRGNWVVETDDPSTTFTLTAPAHYERAP